MLLMDSSSTTEYRHQIMAGTLARGAIRPGPDPFDSIQTASLQERPSARWSASSRGGRWQRPQASRWARPWRRRQAPIVLRQVSRSPAELRQRAPSRPMGGLSDRPQQPALWMRWRWKPREQLLRRGHRLPRRPGLSCPGRCMSRPEACGKSGGRSLPVWVLSAPDVQGMVEVEFHWSGQRQRVRSGCCSSRTRRPSGSWAMLTGSSPSRRPDPGPKPPIVRAPLPPLPGFRIDRSAAGHLFDLKGVPWMPGCGWLGRRTARWR